MMPRDATRPDTTIPETMPVPRTTRTNEVENPARSVMVDAM